MSSNENTPTSPRTVTLEVNTDYSDAARFPAWVALMVFSIVCLAALESRKGLFSADSAGEKWALAVCLMSMIFAFLAVVAYLMMRSIFVGQIPEMGLLVFLTACWASGLPAIMNRKSIKRWTAGFDLIKYLTYTSTHHLYLVSTFTMVCIHIVVLPMYYYLLFSYASWK